MDVARIKSEGEKAGTSEGKKEVEKEIGGGRKRLFITGGAGFIGANLVRHFNASYDVHIMVREGSNLSRLQGVMDTITIHHADITDADGVARAIEDAKPEYIIHTAVYGGYPQQKDRFQMLRTNLVGLFNLLDACKRHPFTCFVNVGTNSEYGKKKAPMRETDVLEPDSDYGFFKATATLYCQKVARTEHLPITTLRIISAYGPYEEKGRLLTDIMTALVEGEAPKLSSPDIVRGFTYVEDICTAFAAALAHPEKVAGEIFNISGGEEHTISEVVEHARKLFPASKEAVYGVAAPRAAERISWIEENAKFCNATGWRPQHTLQQGIAKTAQWYKERQKCFSRRRMV